MYKLLRWALWAFKKFPDWKKRGRFVGNPLLSIKGPQKYLYIHNPEKPFAFERGTHPTEFIPKRIPCGSCGGKRAVENGMILCPGCVGSGTVHDLVVPRDMETDGGSIPQIAWSLFNLTPWTYLPAFIIHDWEFEQHHRKESSKSFEDVNTTLCEAVYTLMCDGWVPYSSFNMRLIYDGCSSPLGELVWDRGIEALGVTL